MKFRYDFVSFLHSPCSVAALFFILSSIIPSLKAQDNEFFTECSKPFNCGAFKNLSFPFWGENRPQYCGQTEFWLNCSRNRQFPGILINREEFQVHEIHQFGKPQMMILSRPLNSLTGNHSCPAPFNYSFFPLLNKTVQTTLFRSCRESDRASQRISCSMNGRESLLSFFGDDNVTELKKNCPDYVKIPVQKRAIEELKSGDVTLSGALAREFEVKYTAYDAYCLSCNKSGGICGTGRAVRVQFACYCADGPHDTKCRGSDVSFNWALLVVLVGMTAIVIGLASVIVVLKMGKRIRRLGVFMTTTKSDCDIEAFIRNYGTLAPKRYNFSDVKKMTNCYKEKLGQGGYGDVYKGNLPNGQFVAVKVLKESKGNGEEFINEVASISRTFHVNIVTLVGFCLKGNKRALIYEFMPNGSLEKFIFKESSTTLDLEEEENKQKLGWEKLYHIAIGIARGLEYLHRGCNTRILHLDIKPHNILLDEEFCPKISDFGLSKLCTRKDSIVSMLEARGTIGYIAPEVFSRNFGAVSHKSDVYSYGMMVLDMVGGKKRNKVGASTSSEYFPDWVYKNLDELELQDQSVTPKEEIDTGKKMILVALWCIQTIPSNRPSINRVIEMLEGSVEALPIPPKPLFSSPPRLVPNSVTTSSFNSVSLVD